MVATKGINLDVDRLQSVQGLNSGGQTQDSVQYRDGGSADYLLNVDFGKLGLWPGGFLTLKAESQFGDFLKGRPGSLILVNADALFPVPFDSTSASSVVGCAPLTKGGRPCPRRRCDVASECLSFVSNDHPIGLRANKARTVWAITLDGLQCSLEGISVFRYKTTRFACSWAL